MKDADGAGYPEQFNKDGSHDLTKVRALRELSRLPVRQPERGRDAAGGPSRRGAKIIDLIVDQSPDGLEVLRGSSTYIYDGNWKLQTENGADGYHVSAVHWNYAATTSRRKERR